MLVVLSFFVKVVVFDGDLLMVGRLSAYAQRINASLSVVRVFERFMEAVSGATLVFINLELLIGDGSGALFDMVQELVEEHPDAVFVGYASHKDAGLLGHAKECGVRVYTRSALVGVLPSLFGLGK